MRGLDLSNMATVPYGRYPLPWQCPRCNAARSVPQVVYQSSHGMYACDSGLDPMVGFGYRLRGCTTVLNHTLQSPVEVC